MTQQAWKRRTSGGVPSHAEATDAEPTDASTAGERGEPGGAQSEVDLKATVTLSGEALAALLEEVKAAQRAAAGRQADPVELADDVEVAALPEVASAAAIDEASDWQSLPTPAPTLAPPPPFRRGPQRSSGKT